MALGRAEEKGHAWSTRSTLEDGPKEIALVGCRPCVLCIVARMRNRHGRCTDYIRCCLRVRVFYGYLLALLSQTSCEHLHGKTLDNAFNMQRQHTLTLQLYKNDQLESHLDS
jgi:hypothetical protein